MYFTRKNNIGWILRAILVFIHLIPCSKVTWVRGLLLLYLAFLVIKIFLCEILISAFQDSQQTLLIKVIYLYICPNIINCKLRKFWMYRTDGLGRETIFITKILYKKICQKYSWLQNYCSICRCREHEREKCPKWE